MVSGDHGGGGGIFPGRGPKRERKADSPRSDEGRVPRIEAGGTEGAYSFPGGTLEETASDLGPVAGIESDWDTYTTTGRFFLVSQLAGSPVNKKDSIRGGNGPSGDTEEILSTSRVKYRGVLFTLTNRTACF